jgi:hypothetical protein
MFNFFYLPVIQKKILNTKHNFMIMSYNDNRNLTFMVSQKLA